MDALARSLRLQHYIPYQIGLLASRTRARLSTLALDKRDLTIPEWRVLVLVSDASLYSARDIVQHSDMDHVTVHRAAIRLEKRGLLYRVEDPANRRLKLLRLSSKGSQILEAILPIAFEMQDTLMAALAPADREALTRILPILLDVFAEDGSATALREDGQAKPRVAAARKPPVRKASGERPAGAKTKTR